DCAQACNTDTDADLSEPHLADMVACIRLCQNCVDICAATAAVLSRPANWDSRVVRPLVEACATICASCGEECERHAPTHAHCRVCAEACRRCEQACGEFLKIMK
ncbi:MAG: four-helix bundle copper-binding protein, partial [Nocardiopsaceae bacterium]|nr:four-helix bundle copper-binding protein [Nocardiopsaceae bacterium]